MQARVHQKCPPKDALLFFENGKIKNFSIFSGQIDEKQCTSQLGSEFICQRSEKRIANSFIRIVIDVHRTHLQMDTRVNIKAMNLQINHSHPPHRTNPPSVEPNFE